MESLEIICEIGLTESTCTDKYMCPVCPFNKNSASYNLNLVYFYKEAKLIGELITKMPEVGPDAEGIR